MAELQERVRAEMARRAMRAPDVMRPVGMSPSALTKWLASDLRPAPKLTRAIGVAFGWPLDWPDRDAVEPSPDDDRLDQLLSALRQLGAMLEGVHESQLRIEAHLGMPAERSTPLPIRRAP